MAEEIKLKKKYRPASTRWPKSQKSRTDNNKKKRVRFRDTKSAQGEQKVMVMENAYRGSVRMVLESQVVKKRGGI